MKLILKNAGDGSACIHEVYNLLSAVSAGPVFNVLCPIYGILTLSIARRKCKCTDRDIHYVWLHTVPYHEQWEHSVQNVRQPTGQVNKERHTTEVGSLIFTVSHLLAPTDELASLVTF